MRAEELIAKLGRYEWRDVEFKRAQRGVPDNAYTTVSAFANTSGGYLVFGIEETHGEFDIVGVIEVDRVQNDFLSVLRGRQKLNRLIEAQETWIEHEGKTLLVFYIPEAQRTEKPVYLNGDIRKSYIRRGGGDERCTLPEIERFLRESAANTYDTVLLNDLDAEDFFDPDTVAWYRRLQENHGNRHTSLSDLEFLNEWGFVVESGNTLLPTRAAVLVFGKARYVRRILPRAIVDYQRIDSQSDAWSADKRWDDRFVAEENLIQAWLSLVERYSRAAERSFSLDAATLRRHDDPPDYISFREATINLLIHQDYRDHTRKPTIKIFTDRSLFWNPGDAFATTDQLLEPIEKEVRNPAIANAFRRIGLSDQAGSGIRAIFSNWLQMGFVPPIINNDKADKTFEIALLKELLLTEEQRLFQAQVGVRLGEQDAAVFAYACRKGTISLTDAKSAIGRGSRYARAVLDRLAAQVLLAPLGDGVAWELPEYLKDRVPGTGAQLTESPNSLVTDQGEGQGRGLVSDQADGRGGHLVIPLLTKLTDHQRHILVLCEVPRKQTDMMRTLGLTHRAFFRRMQLEPLMRAGLLRMTRPEQPTHPEQAYVVTEGGLDLLVGGRLAETKDKE
jgi:ATP-dependent DNA helicase RecG